MAIAYLIVADKSPEFDRSLRYAALAARSSKADILILHVLPEPDLQLWSGVEDRIMQEQDNEAKELLSSIQDSIRDIADVKSDFVIERGGKTDAVLKTLAARSEITKLIVTTNVQGGGKGVVLSYFTGAGIDKLSVPLTMVPGHVPIEDIDKLVV